MNRKPVSGTMNGRNIAGNVERVVRSNRLMRRRVWVSVLLAAALLAGMGGAAHWFMTHRPPTKRRAEAH